MTDSASVVPDKPRIKIVYCPRCNWLPRSAWMAQELLHTFADTVGEVALVPAERGGTFEIWVSDQLLWERRRDGGFPDAKILKQRVRDLIAPDRELGHLDR